MVERKRLKEQAQQSRLKEAQSLQEPDDGQPAPLFGKPIKVSLSLNVSTITNKSKSTMTQKRTTLAYKYKNMGKDCENFSIVLVLSILVLGVCLPVGKFVLYKLRNPKDIQNFGKAARSKITLFMLKFERL